MNNVFASRFANAPVMVASSHEDWLGHCVQQISFEMTNIQAQQAQSPAVMSDDFWPVEGSWMNMFRPYQVTDGTLVIPIKGLLLHDYGYQLFDWATGYTYIQKAFERGMADPSVQRIAMMINSGGGEVSGNFDLVDRIYAMRGQKPIQAFINEHSYSAAFSLASAADKIILPRTGGTGSVGVVTSHVDMSGRLDEMGMKITFIHAGKHKVDGNSTEPLPAEVKNRMQERIEGLYDVFVKTVSRNLGLDEQAVRGTEALTYSADESIVLGFAHEIRPIDEALIAFSGVRTPTAGEVIMSKEEQQKTSAYSQADLDAARAEGRTEGASAERQRIQGIMGSDEAKNRRDLCFHLSLNTDLSVEAAKGILASSPEVTEDKPKEEGASTGADFSAAMAKGNPELGSEGGQEGGEEVSAADQLLNDYKAYTGFGGDK